MIVSDLKTYYLQTYGCQMNQYDSELIAWMLSERHYAPTEDAAAAKKNLDGVEVILARCVLSPALVAIHRSFGG